ncbi:glycosyltransferase family 2 protein [Vibrio harveyi]|uniref:glycosyltransferase family A protein n=1 Tax=Vibrio harveyi TaxID=669 RepID=UPI00234CF456|nr:glycosyltransferase family 2 protein [Vibrio harveyi]WCP79489.1 glycosyltransferase family 2 protein [Vibrio harveyi]
MNDLDIIIPLYNDPLGINRLLDSVEDQTFDRERVKIYIIDDGSDIEYDFSPYQNLKIIYKKQKNGKQGKARNYGTEISSAEYIWFCDSDDVINKGSIQLILDDICYTNSDILVYNAECSDREVFYEIENSENKEEYLNALSRNRAIVAPWNKLYKRRFLFENHISFPERLSYEDLYHSIITVSKSNHITFSDKCIYKYIVNAGSTTNTFDERIFDVIEVAESILLTKDLNINKEVKKNIFFTHVFKYTLLRIYKSNNILLLFKLFNVKSFWKLLRMWLGNFS